MRNYYKTKKKKKGKAFVRATISGPHFARDASVIEFIMININQLFRKHLTVKILCDWDKIIYLLEFLAKGTSKLYSAIAEFAVPRITFVLK